MIGVDFRLPVTIRPRRYDIALSLDLEAWRFDGEERIDLHLAEPAEEIVLHSADLTIASATGLLTSGGELPAEVRLHPEAEVAVLRFGETIPPGEVALRLRFAGEIAARLRGLYRSTYNGQRFAATQFEAADARRAFPCFDEPIFKARFALTLDVPADVVAIANAPVVEETPAAPGRKRVRFAETPPISSYLVAFTVGPYEATPPRTTRSGVPVRVFLPRGMAGKGLYARDAHVQCLDYLEEYTGIPYPYAKVDAIGVPDFEAGAMENPGAITYRLIAIGADAGRASTHTLQGIFYTAAHELTHMWWGDLVTMAWWDDLWLNEAFATFVGYKVTADLVPQWRFWRDFVSRLDRPLALDALLSTHPVSFEVKNARQATERFDVITYWKGAAVVRMLEAYVGPEIFRAGVQTYLDRFREGNARAADFWAALGEAAGRDVARVAEAWVRRAGHPLVTARARQEEGGLRIELRQERFLADPDATAPEEAPWPIPMTIRHGNEAGSTEHRILFDSPRTEIFLERARWFFPNSGCVGFFRVALDDESMEELSRVLQTALGPEERLGFLDNVWALVRAGRQQVGSFLTLVRGLAAEPDRVVVEALAARLEWLRAHASDPQVDPALARFVRDLFRPRLDQLGWDPAPGDDAETRILRGVFTRLLGKVARDEDLLGEARRRVLRYLDDPASLDPDLADAVVSVAAACGDEALFDRYREQNRLAAGDPEMQERFLAGLTAFERGDLVDRALELSQTDEIRPQDRAHFLARLLANREARPRAWSFVRDRWAQITAGMDPMLRQNLVRALGQLTDETLAPEVDEFLARHQTEETRETAAQTRERLRIDAQICRRLRADLARALERTQ